ncbi:hypothetical protein TWF718_007905 [Orbilia javanica]|uniref:Uncharacterized protein n=1 Tax=Orbilia javanica TaxID=47235 RepID=A0AAN8MW93_9PEZI
MVRSHPIEEPPLRFITPRDDINQPLAQIVSYPTTNEPVISFWPRPPTPPPPPVTTRRRLRRLGTILEARAAARETRSAAREAQLARGTPRIRQLRSQPMTRPVVITQMGLDSYSDLGGFSSGRPLPRSFAQRGLDRGQDRIIHGTRVKLTRFEQLPKQIYPTKIIVYGLWENSNRVLAMFVRRTLVPLPPDTRDQITDVDPTMAVIERLLQQFRCDYLKTAVGTFSEDRCRKMFLMKYKNYKFTQIRTDGRDIWGKWVVKRRFGREVKGGAVVWRRGRDLLLVEPADGNITNAPQSLIRKVGSLFGLRSIGKGFVLRSCESMGMGSRGPFMIQTEWQGESPEWESLLS